MQEWDRLLRRESERCAGCDRRFARGDTVTTHLEWKDAAFHREDRCDSCRPAEPASAFATWKRQIGARSDTGPPRLDLPYLTELLKRLDGREDDASRRLMYIVTLLLLRRRVLEQLEGSTDQRLSVRLRKEEREFGVDVPVLDGATVAAMEQDLGRLFRLDSAAAPG